MIDSSLKELLDRLKRVNELSKEAISKLSQISGNEEVDTTNGSNIIENLTNSITTLNEEAAVAKTLHHKLSTRKSKKSKKADPLGDTLSSQELGKDSIKEATEQCTSKSTEDLNDKVPSSENGIESVEEPSGDKSPIDQSENNSVDSMKDEVVDKPLLKIIDFNKLVDPRNLELMDENEKKKMTNVDTSVIVLSSSDDEALVKNKLPETVEDKKSKSKNLPKKAVTFEVASTSNSGIKKTTNSVTKEQHSIQIGNVAIKSSHKGYMIIKNDEKYRSKLYVKLLKVPCEEMKNYYLNRQDKNEYRSDNSLRKGDKTSQCSNDSASDSKEKEKKSNNESKSGKSSKECSNESSDEGTQSPDLKKKVLSKRKSKRNSLENTDSSEDESEKVLGKKSAENIQENSHDRKNKKGINSRTKVKANKSKYMFSDDEEIDHKNSASESSGSEEKLKNSDDLEEKNTSKDKASSEIEIDDQPGEDQSSSKKGDDSDEQIVINSDESDNSDFDTFVKKNKLNRNIKKIKTFDSDSENDETQADNIMEHIKSDKESDRSDNPSDKEEDKGEIRKRKRIKEIQDNSSESDEAVTRKKLKKLISKDSLSAQTKKAAAEERERKQRILDKQQKYNQIYESTDLANSRVEKLVLDVDEKTEQPLLEVDKALVSKLKPHQASGIQFMWDACFESIKRIEKSHGSGCILAHCMGLGKTLQVIALTNTLLEEEKTKVKKVLIVTPLSTVLNWKAEFKNWLSGEESYEVFELVSVRPQNAERACYVRQWHENGGVLIISYAMFRNLTNEKNRKISKKIRTIFMEGLVDPGPDLVICDEGHLLKNERTSLSIAMNKIKTRRRIVLTGTPLQNNLKEYYCMVQFVKPNLLGTYKEYLNRFVNPITNGQYTDSTQYDINLMRRRSHVLHKLLDGIVQRRDYSVLAPYLPPKFEFILFLTLSDTQKKLYKHYMDHFARKSDDDGSSRASFLFKDFQALSRICIHPRVLLDKSNDDQLKYQSDEESVGSLKDFIDDDESSSTPESSESESDSDSKKKKKRATKRITRAQKNNPTVKSESEEEIVEVNKEWWQEYCDGEELDNIAHSTKLLLLFEILKECEQIGDKVLLFSQSLYALNLIEYFLGKVDEATQNGDADEKTCGYTGSWSPGLDYFRLDGSTNCSLRSEWCDAFNKEDNSRARLFLLSTRAGGLGINLVAANRVILFDVSWNPSSDVQSIYRVYRFGQLKPSYVYRFVVYGAMEMKIYERQVTKQAISKRVIDEQQIDRHYNQNDLAELYKYEEPDLDVRPTPLVPKDVLLGEMLINHEDKIYKYHEHQTLLENKEDEILNEEERKAAWDEFENEKTERTKQPLIGKFSVNTVQLALRSIIQRDNPSWNNNQILSIIPQLIQQLNLQLSQGDQTMYNRIAAEIKVMQNEYARKMQLQLYQYRLQLAQNQMQNMFQPRFPMMNVFSRMVAPNVANINPSGSNFNPNEVVDLN